MSWSRWKLLPLQCDLGSRISHGALAALLSFASKPVTLFTYLKSHCYQWYHCSHNSLSSLQREKWYLLQISWDSFQWGIVSEKPVTQWGKKNGILLYIWCNSKSRFIREPGFLHKIQKRSEKNSDLIKYMYIWMYIYIHNLYILCMYISYF